MEGMSQRARSSVPHEVAVSSTGQRRIGYFTVMSGALLLFVVAGFSGTLYLRPFGTSPPLSGPLYVHGAVLTAWFLLLFVQALLVRTNNVHLHRRLGVAGVSVAIGVVVASAWILALRDAPFVDEVPGRGFGNLMSLIAFALCVGAGISFRRRPPVHRRLMLLGSIVIVAPALSRIFYSPAGTSGPATPIASIALLLTVVVYDLFEQRRPHGATLSAFGLIFLLAPAITWALIETGVWPTFVRLVS